MNQNVNEAISLGALGRNNESRFKRQLLQTIHAVKVYIKAVPARICNSAKVDQEIPSITPLRHLVWAYSFYVLGIVAGYWSFENADLGLLLVSWAMTIHGARKLQLTLGHACAHGSVMRDPENNHILGQIIHASVMATAFDIYAPSHTGVHHDWQTLATDNDPTSQTLALAGIVPGVPKKTLYLRLLIACFSPVFHLSILKQRFVSHLHTEGTYRVLFMTSMTILAALLFLLHGALAFSIVVLVPLIWGYQVSQLLRLCVEHRLPADPHFPRPASEMQELTDEYILRLFNPVDMLIRFLCLTCDSVRHAYHHYQPRNGDWANYISAGPRAVQAAHAKGRLRQYHEIVGFSAAIDGCFEALSLTLEEK